MWPANEVVGGRDGDDGGSSDGIASYKVVFHSKVLLTSNGRTPQSLISGVSSNLLALYSVVAAFRNGMM